MDDVRELSLVHAPGPPVQVGVAQLSRLELGQQLVLVDVEVHREQPRAQQRERVLRFEVGACAAMASVALEHHPLDDAQHGGRVGPGRRIAVAERSDRQRHRRMRPFGRAALLAMRRRASGADVGEKLLGRARARGLGERPADVDSGVVIGPTDGGSPWVSMYTNAGRFSSLALEPLRVSQIGNSSASRRRWRAVSGAATA